MREREHARQEAHEVVHLPGKVSVPLRADRKRSDRKPTAAAAARGQPERVAHAPAGGLVREGCYGVGRLRNLGAGAQRRASATNRSPSVLDR